jgi:hypothetical protein
MEVFTPGGRDRLREALIAAARADDRIAAAALTGSAAAGATDRWSDIDLALSVAGHADLAGVLAGWTGLMYSEHGALHHVDVRRGGTIYRVFLLGNTLQVDIAFCPAAEFGAIGPTFALLFGAATEQRQPAADPEYLIGMAWLHALHARSSIERGRVWQAEYMVSGVRDHVVALACLRHRLPAVHCRGTDDLPGQVRHRLAGALCSSLDVAELRRAFAVAVSALITEIEAADQELAGRICGVLCQLARPG